MQVRWNPEEMTEVFALPAGVVDRHIRLAGSVQLKVLLWLAREGRGGFDADRCAAAIGQSPADCTDALQYWLETGLVITASEAPKPMPPEAPAVKTEKPAKAPLAVKFAPAPAPRPRPAAVKPQMQEVIARQKASSEFAYLLDNASARLGKALSPGDMETLLYLFDSAGIPAEVILMVIVYAVSEGKTGIRYIEKVALDWADRGIDTIDAAEEHLRRMERRQEAWERAKALLGVETSGTGAQKDAAERWLCLWGLDESLVRLAGDQCREKIGKCNVSYVDKILEGWHADGIDSPAKAKAAEGTGRRKKAAAGRESSLDMDAYLEMAKTYIPKF